MIPLAAAEPASASLPELTTDLLQEYLITAFKVSEAKKLPFGHLEHLQAILNHSENISFAEPEERYSPLLIFAACFYVKQTDHTLAYISSNWTDALRAAEKRDYYLKILDISEEKNFPVIIPGMPEFNDIVREVKVLFMHGKDYSQYLPENWEGRKIIQLFPQEEICVNHHPPFSFDVD